MVYGGSYGQDCVSSFRGFKDVIPKVKKEMVNLANKAGFIEGEEADVSQVFF